MAYKLNSKKFIFQKIDKDLIGIDIEESVLFTFNATAEFIIKKLTKGWNEKKIVTELAKKFDAKRELLENDVQSTLGILVTNNVIIRSPKT